MGVEQSIHVRQGGVNSLFERALLDALREAAEESQVPSEQFEHAWDPEDCSPKFRVLRDRLTARRLPSPLTTDAIRGMFTIQEIPLPQKQFRTKRCATILFTPSLILVEKTRLPCSICRFFFSSLSKDVLKMLTHHFE